MEKRPEMDFLFSTSQVKVSILTELQTVSRGILQVMSIESVHERYMYIYIYKYICIV